MNTIDLYKHVKKSMPEVIDIDILKYINYAYKALVNQDSNDFIWLNRDDENFPYPILSGGGDSGSTYPNAKEGKVYSQTKWEEDWKNNLRAISYSIRSFGYGSAIVDTSNEYVDIKVNFEGTDYDVKARKVKSIFTFYSSSVASDFQDIYRPIMMEYQFYSKYNFVKVPFTTIPKKQDTAPVVTFFGLLNRYAQPFFIEFYYEPPDITSVNSPIFIDIQKWLQPLNEGSVAFYEKIVNGVSDKLEYFNKRWLPEFKMESSYSSSESQSSRFRTRYI